MALVFIYHVLVNFPKFVQHLLLNPFLLKIYIYSNWVYSHIMYQLISDHCL